MLDLNTYLDQKIQTILDLGFEKLFIPQLKAYLHLLWKANEELNLISRKMTVEELIENHLIDCLLPLKLFPTEIHSVADFGSGGGLPGVVYAIQFPQMEFHLFEKSPKKQEFLNLCAKIAPNIRVHGEIPLELKNIDLVISRAFKPLDVILDMSRRYYQNNGKYFLFKGRMEKINEEITDAKKKFKELSVNVIPLKSPVLEVERHLLLINC